MRQRRDDVSRRLNEIEAVIVVFVDARSHGEDIRIEDDVLRRKAGLLGQQGIGAGTTLADAMRAARDSIWVVGFDLPNGKFIGVGTAWAIQPKMLATNAHVLGDPRYLDIESPGNLNELAASGEFEVVDGPTMRDVNSNRTVRSVKYPI